MTMPHAPLLDPWTPLPGLLHASYLAEVVSVRDPENLARVQVRLLGYDGVEDQDAALWARVAAPFAGADRGAFLIPDVGDEVLVTFAGGNPRHPVVLGGLWNCAASPPERLGGAGDRVDRWTLVGRAGTRIAIIEEGSGQETIRLETPGGVSSEITDRGGGRVEVRAAGCTITVDPSGVSIETGAKVSVQASQVDVSAGMVSVSAAMSTFSGVVQCDTLITNAVISSSYTPGAGNVW
jgi:uncharacterized protein involved in type VI secretion and phage assembly